MADAKPATGTPTKRFQHDGKPVFVLIPQNSGYAKTCISALEEQFSTLENPPEVTSELKVKQLPPDTILYVMHPIKERKKDSRGKFRNQISTHISPAIDVFKVASDSNKKGYRTMNQNLLAQTVTNACQNDPAGMFFRATLTSESTKFPDSLMLKLSEQ